MKLIFPDYFRFGTSTAANQIESAFEHDWIGVLAHDGTFFDSTTDHEKRYDEDIGIIASLAPNYRMSLMWSRLQRGPMEAFHEETKLEYHTLLKKLKASGVDIMMVLHHFANPIWFASNGGWEKQSNIQYWVDFAKKMVDEFGPYVTSWNTFNEPNLYTSMGWLAKEFPPFKSNFLTARKVLKHIAEAHEQVYAYIKSKFPNAPVGISHNCTVFEGLNWVGNIPAKLADWIYMDYPFTLFKSFDFFGMSYYARICYDPFPITYLQTPDKIIKLNKEHDDMWEYYPEGLRKCMERYWKKFKKPIVITENGICTTDDRERVKAIEDYLKLVHSAITDGIDVRGYFHWSTWDNFEWSLGPSYRFGLYACNWETKERARKKSADVFSKVAFTRILDISR
jgi:beta-glucosidase